MKAILTLDLQSDAGVSIITGTQTKVNFTGNDIELVRSFLIGLPLRNLVELMGWIADGVIPQPSPPPVITISNLK